MQDAAIPKRPGRSSDSGALLLAGSPGVGKTTILRRVAEALAGKKIRGFTTEEIRRGGERVGFSIETFDRERAVLAHVSIRSQQRVSRYGVDVEALDRIVAKALAPSPRADLYLVDEIGRMECFSERFVAAMKKLLGSKRLVVATVALRGGGFIEEVKKRPDVELRTVTRSNRDEMPSQILDWIRVRGAG